MYLQKVISKNYRIVCILKDRGTDPRIRTRTKMLRIRNTVFLPVDGRIRNHTNNEGSGFGRLKNIRIRIHKTGYNKTDHRTWCTRLAEQATRALFCSSDLSSTGDSGLEKASSTILSTRSKHETVNNNNKKGSTCQLMNW
jgi:hypothetical protein